MELSIDLAGRGRVFRFLGFGFTICCMEELVGRSLLLVFAKVPDPRSAKGRRHPLSAILTLSIAAMLSGARSIYAIYQWGRLQPPEVVRSLGFTRDRTPTVSTLDVVFRALDVATFESVLSEWAQSQVGDRAEAIAIDGKGLRGIHGEELPGVRLVAAYSQEAGLVLAQSGGQPRSARGGVGSCSGIAQGGLTAGEGGDR